MKHRNIDKRKITKEKKRRKRSKRKFRRQNREREKERQVGKLCNESKKRRIERNEGRKKTVEDIQYIYEGLEEEAEEEERERKGGKGKDGRKEC